MAEFKVTNGVIVLGGKSYKRDDIVDLNDQQAERLSPYIASVEVSKAEAKAAEAGNSLSDLTFDELKSLADSKDVEVEGTGKNGAIKKVDLLKALSE